MYILRAVQKKERDGMTGHEAREDMKEKKKKECVKGKGMKRGTKRRGRESMKPNLITTT